MKLLLGFLLTTSLFAQTPVILKDSAGVNAASVSAGGALKTDASASTQPVSGTVAATESGTWSMRLQDGSGNVINSTSNALNTFLSNTSIAVTGTFWQATQPVSGTFWQTTQPVSGTFFQATQPVSGTVAATQSGNWTARIVGNAGASVDAATGAAPPANALLVAGLGSGATGGFMTAIPVCDSFFNINIATNTTTLAVTGVSGRHVRICAISMVALAADNVGIISGTGATCGTGTAAIVGTTAATGYNLSANGGIAMGSGIGTIMRTVATGDSVCVVTSASTQLSGVISYAIY